MSLNPFGTANYSWNYSRPDKEGYSTTLVGTVVAIQEVQKMMYSQNPNAPRYPEFWPDGNPKFNIRLALVTRDGEIKTFTFQPAGKAAKAGQKKSVHLDLFALTGNTNMMNLIGKTICIQTEEPPAGFGYGQGHPRPWYVSLVEEGPYQYNGGEIPSEFKVPRVLANSAVSGGQVQAPQQPQMQQYPQQQQSQYPQQQPVQQAPMYPQPMQQQPVYPQPAQPQYPTQQYTQPVQQQQPAYPQGMDPNIAAAMQQVGATVTEVQQEPVVGTIYDGDIPF